MRSSVKFVHRGRVVELSAAHARMTLLDWLRITQLKTGTKEGCAEGDCGACTIVLRRLVDGQIITEAVNSCILLAGQADGCEVVTVEDLSSGGALHPVQRAMVDLHGSQCGFCTPGIVMSLYALRQEAVRPVTAGRVCDALAGNLCRCTGYRPIVEAALQACRSDPDHLPPHLAGLLSGIASDDDLLSGDTDGFFAAPRTEQALATLLALHPDALLVGGATDIGLRFTKDLVAPQRVIWLGRVAGLGAIGTTPRGLSIGATASLAQAATALAGLAPDLAEIVRRFGSPQVRASATVGGNIANGSPIGDLAPCLIALGAELELMGTAGGKLQIRRMPLENYFLSYKRQDRQPGEIVRRVLVPLPDATTVFRAYKISKRLDEDISTVLGAFALHMQNTRIVAARVAFGGMAGVPARAQATEQALAGLDVAAGTPMTAAFAALDADFSPMSDHRASAAYRTHLARTLLEKAIREAAGVRPSHVRMTAQSRPVAQAETMSATQTGSDQKLEVVSRPHPQDSAGLHVTGGADYIDDMREPLGTLHIACGLSPVARGRLVALGLDAVRAVPGVVAVLTAADVPGKNDIAPAFADEPLLAVDRVLFHGQPLFAVVATDRETARRACRLAVIDIVAETPVVTIEQALEAHSTVLPDYDFRFGDAAQALSDAPHVLSGRFVIGGQEHFYLEGQAALAVPGEGGTVRIFSSTQDPSEVQHIAARVLGVVESAVVVETRRMGGAFGGKESQACQWATLAALGARVTGQPVKIRLDRDDDFAATGKRHDFRADWQVGYAPDGRLLAYDVMLNARCGCSVDLSPGVVDRAMFHATNAYYVPDAVIGSKRLRTDTVSNTAFRGFGGPQGVLAIERVMDAIAHASGRDPLDVRKLNLFGPNRDITPYGMRVDDTDTLRDLVDELERTSCYRARRAELATANAQGGHFRRGLALTPVQFGISFTLAHMNQAGALLHVYQDGSVLLNHGGTEMGQGLFVKVAQVVAEELGLPLAAVRPSATSTAMVPNASPTAASAGSDLNGMAARIAALEIKQRLTALLATHWSVAADTILFAGGRVSSGNRSLSFGEVAAMARKARVSLSATGFYKTPDITWDRETRTGKPFYYFAYGAACTEVLVDTQTGEMRVERVDILHDVGRSLNPAIDIGQIEGGFVQGMGWLTTEELVFDANGRLATHAPSTYKIPVASDVPADFRVRLTHRPNGVPTIYRSKGVGEPPLMLATSVFSAILDALASLAPGQHVPLDAPATPERIALAARALTARPQSL